jgi:hypothetical protein
MRFVLIHYKLTYLILIHTSSPTSRRAHLIRTQHHLQRPAHEQTPRSTSYTSLSEVRSLSGPSSLEEAGLGCGVGLFAISISPRHSNYNSGSNSTGAITLFEKKKSIVSDTLRQLSNYEAL